MNTSQRWEHVLSKQSTEKQKSRYNIRVEIDQNLVNNIKQWAKKKSQYSCVHKHKPSSHDYIICVLQNKDTISV